MKKQVWFWQLSLSPHIIYLAKELNKIDIEVHFVACEIISQNRQSMGWEVENFSDLNIHILENGDFSNLIPLFSKNAKHICSGFRGNGYILKLEKFFKKNKISFYVIMETVNAIGIHGFLKKIYYKKKIWEYRKVLNGILTIGYTLPEWLHSLGFSRKKIFPFTYFLEKSNIKNELRSNGKFKIIFVGNFSKNKQPDMLLDVIDLLSEEEKSNIELLMIGRGALEDKIRQRMTEINIETKFLGVVDIKKVREYIASSDCLILPSKHDGWGAVVSEALLEGTQVICSNTCGSAGLIKKSGFGYTFDYYDEKMLLESIENIIKKGKLTIEERCEIKTWAKELDVIFGANYLYSILFETHQITPKWS